VTGPRNFRELIEAEVVYGQSRRAEFVKNISQTTTQGLWFDMTGGSGNPRAKQWFDAQPLKAQQVLRSTDGGIDHGAPVQSDGFAKYLRELRVACGSTTPLPMTLMLCDYLLYYPSIDESETSAQTMDNTITLPRYTDGAGVQMMAVTISGGAGGQTFTVSYTNSDGTAGRTSTATMNAAAALGTITTSSTTTSTGGNPFLTLQGTDIGVRSIDSVQINGSDTGFFALVLVRPLANIMLQSNITPSEKDFVLFASELPRIYDDAFLSFLAQPNGSLSGLPVRGSIKTVWN